ncbi:MAG: diphthine synthase [Candidatus Aenigmatarchaeota archaeon]|nr:MAG: diphthine synthase [Candidatus Aenigmarchaeota archaeon]
MIYLIGLGIGGEHDISLRGLQACEKAKEVYAELYTAGWPGDLKKLGKRIGKDIKLLKRKDIEEEVRQLVKLGKNKNIAILVPGDPLTATTHLNVLMEAREQGVKTEIIHSSSILTAVAETGLSLYNFGKTVTIVRPGKDYAPTSFYDTAVKNSELGMHTLFLLDIDMDTSEGIQILMQIEQQKKKGLIDSDRRFIAASGLGSADSKVMYNKALEIVKRPLEPPAVLILPGKLHFTEEEFLKSLKRFA